MKIFNKFLITVLLLAITSNAYALNLSRVKTWAASEILTAADLNGEFNNILNHSLTNNDIDAAAGIVGSKLNLSSPGIIGATTPAAATYTTLTINSTSIFKDKMSFTQTDNNEYIDSLADGYLDFEATTGLRWRINTVEQVNLIDGILAPTTDNDIDLGSTTKEFKDLWITGTANIDSLVADTADINGGTLDLVQIGGTTATGELIVNDASDDADGLGSQGTSGQFLRSNGTGVNPSFADTSFIFIETNTFSAVTSVSITETISSGDVYKIIFEGIENSPGSWEPAIRINSDSSGTNYDYSLKHRLWDGSSTGTGGITETNDSHNAANEISLVGAGITLATGMPFYIELTIMARGNQSQVYFKVESSLGGNAIRSSEGRGAYDAGIPTSIELVRISGTGTISGRNYVYKLGTSP